MKGHGEPARLYRHIVNWFSMKVHGKPYQSCKHTTHWDVMKIPRRAICAGTLSSFVQWASYQIRKSAGCACAWNAGNVFPAPQVSDPDMHHGTCVTHVPWCIPESLTSGFLWNRWRGKRSRHCRRMRTPLFHVSGKRPIWKFLREPPHWCRHTAHWTRVGDNKLLVASIL